MIRYCLAVLLFTFNLHALKIEITKGDIQPDPIAVVDFHNPDSIDNLGEDIAKVLINDLEASGLFVAIGKTAFLQTADSLVASGPNMSNWRPLKARFLVYGEVKKLSSDKITISFRLFDVLTGQQMQGLSYNGEQKNWRRMTHIMADSIYGRTTGETGVFDSKIVFIEDINNDRKNPKKRMMIMDWDGFNPQALTDGKNLVLTPRVSPDAQKVAYLSYINQQPRVYIMDLKNKSSKELGHFPGMTLAPRFSPDSSKVVMSYEKDGASAVYIMDVASGKKDQLTEHRCIDTSPCYSPDGNQIVFVSDRDGPKPQLFVMDTSGGNVRRISFGKGGSRYFQPAWSPRGDLIAFTKQVEGTFYIGVMFPDGTGERLIAQGYMVESPTWSPNGRYIMYSRQGSLLDKSQIDMIDLTGRNRRRIPTQKGATDGSWSPLMTSIMAND
ncbi:MAG: Tol-Pal system beta propeller repeat protein TolB [Proteobacteria bacterium]|jgi:TolB protein|nr:Tol-Pal system beta propeller repeat protein TolB [Pseudomonadota bacterium]